MLCLLLSYSCSRFYFRILRVEHSKAQSIEPTEAFEEKLAFDYETQLAKYDFSAKCSFLCCCCMAKRPFWVEFVEAQKTKREPKFDDDNDVGDGSNATEAKSVK